MKINLDLEFEWEGEPVMDHLEIVLSPWDLEDAQGEGCSRIFVDGLGNKRPLNLFIRTEGFK